jgi:hypothetical protein
LGSSKSVKALPRPSTCRAVTGCEHQRHVFMAVVLVEDRLLLLHACSAQPVSSMPGTRYAETKSGTRRLQLK